ncbi:putative aldouronate transport system permease protein [Paenibacillus sp. PastH-3]|nr:binding-protein-dependent transport systems inner membrane component [Paenibacillus sp. FSL H8-237]MDH6431433.1 putative aldouronate transport system permease protein [Paenibacillus sp. PastH-4]MDH6447473.1 putative aldouronate transport system permease protein [Paenibacillus sp. PastF-4]MDH6531646.1 putative aldouronate transport system permease protein [Paenibacillus sp. PastH-3]
MKTISGFIKNIMNNKIMLLMVLPGALWFLFFSYLPMIGTIIAFKEYRFSRDGFWASIINSKWVGLDNFKFLFTTNDAYIITRNTLLYNGAFILLGLILSVLMAIVLSEIVNKKLAKVYQTGMFLPYFLSWVVVGYFAFSFLSSERGMLNQIMGFFGAESIQWYSEKAYWPFILILVYLWKAVGYNSVVYLAAIMGIDKSLYEAAMIDGASKFQQIRNITLPLLSPIITIMTLLAIGKIFYADFGLFYQVPRNSGTLYSVTNVIDTYVYQGLKTTGEIGMSTAAGLYQSVVGFTLVMTSNYIVRKYNKDSALF